ncbi:hypothetical protein [Burkholderia cenocepacia]|uniref:hypothetical protein n=1 Tax=Burkholderia cenocepacia TaxID=95486 RepID=UPI002AAF4545|nr:hypothetical protein [Burkholderia cenocepacia]
MVALPDQDDIARVVVDFFGGLGGVAPNVYLKEYGGSKKAIYIDGAREDEWCWVNLIEWPQGHRINELCPYACSIESRGANLFSACVTSAISLSFGKRIYDDAGYLIPGREFSPDEFKKELLERMIGGA